jgi:hypothetical protein
MATSGNHEISTILTDVTLDEAYLARELLASKAVKAISVPGHSDFIRLAL